MSDKTRKIVRETVLQILRETVSDRSIEKSRKIHIEKIHFVPVPYRVLGGRLQSLNIKFGNFIEQLVTLVVRTDGNVETLTESGQKIPLSMTAETDTLIDQYITTRQLADSPTQSDESFKELLDTIIRTEQSPDIPKQTIIKDVDALFRTRQGTIIYLEIKYNDDHDTGKFVDINRKLIKTYAGLVNRLGITDISQMKPILYYFNPHKRWGPIYVPADHIYRGAKLFDEFFETSFAAINEYLRSLGDDPDIIAIFDDLYKTIRYDDRNL